MPSSQRPSELPSNSRGGAGASDSDSPHGASGWAVAAGVAAALGIGSYAIYQRLSSGKRHQPPARVSVMVDAGDPANGIGPTYRHPDAVAGMPTTYDPAVRTIWDVFHRHVREASWTAVPREAPHPSRRLGWAF